MFLSRGISLTPLPPAVLKNSRRAQKTPSSDGSAGRFLPARRDKAKKPSLPAGRPSHAHAENLRGMDVGSANYDSVARQLRDQRPGSRVLNWSALRNRAGELKRLGRTKDEPGKRLV